ncbi:hypothetical protein ACTWQB_15725 [Piscibacillus sp. B03]|uniref:hypothetical protein n=1 Tax=Piscibacillus sp. B03 TaxID=3457430 RepID=UPI003FCE71DC
MKQKTVKIGKDTIHVTYNEPSEEAMKEFNKLLNQLARKRVNKIVNEQMKQKESHNNHNQS